jgi:hypothetical protein
LAYIYTVVGLLFAGQAIAFWLVFKKIAELHGAIGGLMVLLVTTSASSSDRPNRLPDVAAWLAKADWKEGAN